MARRKLSQIERRALWEVGGRVCTYCRDPVKFSVMEVDHIIPQSVESNSGAYASIRAEQDIAASFDINSYENLVAACLPCNRRKASSQFPAGRIAIELAAAARAKVRVEACVRRLTREAEADRVRFLLSAAVESGAVSPVEIAQLARRGPPATVWPGIQDPFHGLHLFDVKPEDVARIKDRAVSPDDGVTMESLEGNDSVQVFTMNEFERARSEGRCPRSTYDMNMAFLAFDRPLQILNIALNAAYPDQSCIDNPRAGLCDVALLPATLLWSGLHESQASFYREGERLSGRTIQNLITSQEAKLVEVGSSSVRIVCNDYHFYMMEIMRADVDGDGFEDIVVHHGSGPVGGTFSEGHIKCLKRTAANAIFEETEPGGLLG